MLDLRLEYAGEGNFVCRTRFDRELVDDKLKAGERVRAKVTRPRSARQNDFFHAIVEAAFDNQRAGPQFPTWRHLKSWLLIQVGHCEVKTFPVTAMTPSVAAWLRRQHDNIDFAHDGDHIYAYTAKSISFAACGGEKMDEIVDAVIVRIINDICPGMDPLALRRHGDAAVAPPQKAQEEAKA
ncbi:MAG: hypothetical protein AAFY06_00110 [Pseudomonadota bacterium]